MNAYVFLNQEQKHAYGEERFGACGWWWYCRDAGGAGSGEFRVLCLSCGEIKFDRRDDVAARQDLSHQ
nr:hypothetical protein GZ18F2_51 [uncultured archaeon GZfos18F2]